MAKQLLVPTRRAFITGLGASVVAAGALADTPFTTFAFPATGATASRTDPARWADFRNVLDYTGVDPTGATDSTAGLQAAYTAAAQSGSGGLSSRGNTVFHPPGQYKVTGHLVPSTGANGYVNLIGAGQDQTLITGSFSGYILDQPDGTKGQFKRIEGIGFNNTNFVAGSGDAKLWGGLSNLVVISCNFFGFIGLDCSVENFQPNLIGLAFSGNANAVGSIGLLSGNGLMSGIAVVGYDTGIRAVGTGFGMIGSRTERNNIGLQIGGNDGAGSFHAGSGLVSGHTTERCNTGVLITNANTFAMRESFISGSVDVAGTGVPAYGIRALLGTLVTFSNVTVSAYASVAGIDLSATDGQRFYFDGVNANTNSHGPNWIMPTNMDPALAHANMKWDRSNNPSSAIVFANLPSALYRTMSDTYWISDSNTSTMGATIAGGGASLVLGLWNGTNWTVAGK